MQGNFRPFPDWFLLVTSAIIFCAKLYFEVERVSGLASNGPTVISNGVVDRRLLFGGALVFSFDFAVSLGGSGGSAFSLWCRGPMRALQFQTPP